MPSHKGEHQWSRLMQDCSCCCCWNWGWLISKEVLPRKKLTVLDPCIGAGMFVLSVVLYHSMVAFTAGGVYERGFMGVHDDWVVPPIINMEWHPQNSPCPAGWDEPPFRDFYHQPVMDPKPLDPTSKKLCLQRGGIPANQDGQDPRPKANCESHHLKQCMTGDFPYCGAADVPCPLVDVIDLKAGAKASMRTTCSTHIPAANLPWTGCRPIIEVVVAAAPPCFKYDRVGWGGHAHVFGHKVDRKCLKRDTRYRYLQSLAFSFAGGKEAANTPDTGIYYRNEVYFNPACAEHQDEFGFGFQIVRWMVCWTSLLVVVSFASMTCTGFLYPVFLRHGFRPQTIHIETHPWERSCCGSSPQFTITLLLRLVAFVLNFCAAIYSVTQSADTLEDLEEDHTCVDPLVRDFITDFKSALPLTTTITLMMTVGQFFVLALDYYHIQFCTQRGPQTPTEEYEEAAPLFRPQACSQRQDPLGSKYVAAPPREQLPPDMQADWDRLQNSWR